MTVPRSAEIQDGAQAFGLAVDGRIEDFVDRYLKLLYQWNRSAGLTTIPAEAAVHLHIIDSWSVALILGTPASLVDLGAGAGLPGFPLAFLWPDCRVSLVETNRRKVSFLRAVVRELKLENVQVLQRDARMGPDRDERFEAVVGRAFVSPERLPAIADPWLANGGTVVVMAGPTWDRDAAPPEGFERSGQREFTLPGGHEERVLLAYRRGPRRF